MVAVLEIIGCPLFNSQFRRETLNGRQYIVKDAVLIVPGVLAGSDGPILYTEEEGAKEPSIWNGMPIVLRHPVRNGKHVSARDPEVLAEQGLGYIYRASHNGKLASEAWFDEERTAQLHPETYRKVLNGEPVEVSTGLFLEQERTQGTFNGVEYRAVARNYRPDHLAVLPEGRGACGVKDGCGINVNELDSLLVEAKALDLTDNAALGQVRSKVTGYFKRYGAGSGKGAVHEAAQKGNVVIGEKHRELGASAQAQADAGNNPPNWAVDEATWERAKAIVDEKMPDCTEYYACVTYMYEHLGGSVAGLYTNEASMDRNATIGWLVANCECMKGKKPEDLASIPDAALTAIKVNTEKLLAAEKLLANTRGAKVGGVAFVFNAAKGKFVTRNANGEEEECEGMTEEECAEYMENKKKPAPKTNQAQPMTAQQWLAAAPPEIQSAVTNAMQIEADAKKAVVAKLVGNIANDAERQAVGAMLMGKPLPELRMLENLLPKAVPVPVPAAVLQPPQPVFNYTGMAPAGLPVFNGLDEVLDLDEARKSYSKKAS